MLPAWLVISAVLLQMPSNAQAAQPPAGNAPVAAAQSASSPTAQSEKERGDALIAAGKTDEAIQAYTAAVGLDSKYLDAHNQLGVAFVKAGRHQEAVGAFDKALEINGDYTTALYNRGFALKKLGRMDEVVRDFSRYVQLMPDDAGGYFQLAEGHYALGANAEALANYEKFLAMQNGEKSKKSEHAEARVNELKQKVAAAPQAEQPKQAAQPAAAQNAPQSSASVLIVTPEREALCRSKTSEGIALRAEGKKRDAVFAHQDAVNANPADPEALFQLGESYNAMDFFPQAAANWEKVVQSDKASMALKSQAKEKLEAAYQEMARRGMGRDGKFLGEAAATPKADEKGNEILTPAGKPIDPKAREASFKGASLFADGKYAEAIAQYDIAISIHSDVGEFYSARGSAWLASGDPTRALADFTNAHQYKPELALPLFGMGESCLALEKPDEARKHFDEFLKSSGTDATEDAKAKAQQRLQQLDQKKAEGPKLNFK